MKESFYEWIEESWTEHWFKRTHVVFKNRTSILLIPPWANMSAYDRWIQRSVLKDVIDWCQATKVPYMTMNRCVYEVLKEKWGA